MLLRIRGPDGMIRLTVETTTTFGDLGQQVGWIQIKPLDKIADEPWRCRSCCRISRAP